MYHEYQIHQKHYLLLIGERKSKLHLGGYSLLGCVYTSISMKARGNTVWAGFYTSSSSGHGFGSSSRCRIIQMLTEQPVTRLPLVFCVTTGSIFKRGISMFQEGLRGEIFPMLLKSDHTHISGICDTP